jgi:exonuclease III
MNRDRLWNILCWNVRGMNDSLKWPALRNKLEESNASIVCFQETKKAHFDHSFIKKFAPRRFDKFAFIPADGASGGLLIIWVSNLFEGTVLLEESFGLVMTFTSHLSSDTFTLVNVYGPCSGIDRDNFVHGYFTWI